MEKYQLKNLDCAACATKIENNLKKMDEVRFATINFANSTLTIDTDNIEDVKSLIKKIEPDVEIVGKNERTISSPNTNIENKWSVVKDELEENKRTILKAFLSLILLLTGIIFREQLHATPYSIAEYAVFIISYLIVGGKVIVTALKNIIHGQFFDEQFLMTIATVGALAINQLPEAVAVMLFYVIGELFQDVAVGRSRKSIKALLEIKPEYANLQSGNEVIKVSPEDVKIGDIIIVKPGEKVPLDGIIINGSSFVDTAALTGESTPRKAEKNDEILAGVINQSGTITVKVNKLFSESSVSKILELVENATSHKAETEKFITVFSKYYTPVVVFLAVLLAVLPPLLFNGQTFDSWIYRALVVLVISCPCALVISVPLSYFGGIGLASRKGILVKGSNFLDVLTKVKTVVFDKTGTLTKGEFKVSETVTSNGYMADEILKFAAYAEQNSIHPIALSIIEAYKEKIDPLKISHSQEISGQGIKAVVEGKTVFAGNDLMLHKENIEHPVCRVDGTVVHVTVDHLYAGYIVISDSLKEDAKEAIANLKAKKIQTVMLTGDNQYAAEAFAKKLGIDQYYWELLPEDKVKQIENLIHEDKAGKVAFVGDGINDAPVLARADVGIAMGTMGSDAAIETADIVLMTDSPLNVSVAIDIADVTRNIVWQNIIFALVVKLIFIILGVFGIATMWQAVFGDMGVALIAIFNSLRILKK